MIIIVASCHDAGARTLVARHRPAEVALLTCADLSVPGWRHYVAAAGSSVAVVSGREVPLAEITGVVTCLPGVSQLEVLHIVPADRAYVAAEMNAFLLSWLSMLSCPVVNRPSPACLTGAYRRPEHWAYLASQSGMRVRPVRRTVALGASPAPDVLDGVTVTVVGERCLGQVDSAVRAGACRLARAADVEVLTVRVSDSGPGAIFLGADSRPDLTSQETAEVILEHLKERA